MSNLDLISITHYIVNKSIALKDKYTTATNASIEFACIFCQSGSEYRKLLGEIEKQGEIIQDTPTGYTYLLNQPIKTKAGALRLVKIRLPDPARKERGDCDFNTDYLKFKVKHKNAPHFELIKRESFEMLRLSDPSFDVMACFSSIPLSKDLKIALL